MMPALCWLLSPSRFSGQAAAAQTQAGPASGWVASPTIRPGFIVAATDAPTVVASATPTLVPTAVVTPTSEYKTDVLEVRYSYYNPDLGGVNCHTANWNGYSCADTTASGIPWRAYVGKAVAVPPSWLGIVSYGSVLRVLEPDPIKGDYVVIDICNWCETNYWPDHTWRLDFLDTAQRLPWAFPVKVVFVSVITPTPVPTLTPVRTLTPGGAQ